MIYKTLPEHLFQTAAKYPDRGVNYVHPDGSSTLESYPDLLAHAKRLLNGLKNLGIQEGDKVILALEKNSEIIPVLWACFHGGIIPAILQPPVSFTEVNPAAEKLEKVFRLLGKPRVILTHKLFLHWNLESIEKQRLLDYSKIDHGSDEVFFPSIHENDLALIQFSSGSTNDPKGVMLSHKNILCNIRDIIDGIKLKPEDVSVNWMPLFHDMGLFGFHITPLFVGVNHFLIEPADFVKNPFLFLDVMSAEKVRITACPNFGQILINRYLSRKTTRPWDFSSVRVMFNGAEPISVSAMREFISGLERFGFSEAAMFPAYGMAEATLAVTFPPLMKIPVIQPVKRADLLRHGSVVTGDPGKDDVIELVRLGRPLQHCELQIVNDKNQPVEEGKVGNIQVRGDNVTSGYYLNPELTEASFHHGWFVTGDLGFIFKGDLYITGRRKDIIFINGTNYYAHDLEEIACRLSGISAGRLVFAGYFDEKYGRDRIVAFMVGSGKEAVKESFTLIEENFKRSLGLSIDHLVPVKSQDIPRTSSGKLQRYKLISRFLKGEFSSAQSDR